MKTKIITLRSKLNNKNLYQNLIKFFSGINIKSNYISVSAMAYTKDNKELVLASKTLLNIKNRDEVRHFVSIISHSLINKTLVRGDKISLSYVESNKEIYDNYIKFLNSSSF